MALSSHDQSQMFPQMLPVIVQRIWAAKERYFKRTSAKLTLVLLSAELQGDLGHLEWQNEPYSQSTIERARREYPKLLPWPMTKWMRPPWEEDQSESAENPSGPANGEVLGYVPIVDGDGNPKEPLPVVADANGVPHLVRRVPESLIAAMLAGSIWLMLDSMDGRLDAIVRWCHILGIGTPRPF